MLCKESLRYVMSRFAFAGKILIRIGNDPQEGGFPFTVCADERYFIPFFNDGIGMFEDGVTRIRFADIFQAYHMPPRLFAELKSEVYRGVVVVHVLHPFHAFQRLDTRLYHLGFTGLCTEPFYKPFFLLYLSLLVFVG